nr:Ig-like domain-containing protein [Moraxella sp. CTOTU48841]
MKKINTDSQMVNTMKNTVMKKRRLESHLPKTSVKLLTLLVTGFMASSLSQADTMSKNIGDLEIYQSATGGQINLMMMLDTSGSMGISSLVLPKDNPYGSPGDVDTGLCDRVNVYEYNNNRSSTYPFAEWAYNARDTRDGETKGKTSFKKSVTINGTTIPYYLRGCGTASIDTAGKLVEPVNSTGQQLGAFDRLSRLKDALITLLAGTDIKDSIVMGLGQFSSKTEINISGATNKIVDGHSGRILVKAAPLNQDQRIKLIQAIAGIQSLDTTTNQDGSANDALKFSSNNYPNVTKASSGTPAAHAYAEAGAYMMGTTTGKDPNPSSSVSIVYDGSMTMQNPTTKEQVYFICVGLGGGETNIFNGKAKVKQCVNNWPGYDTNSKMLATGTINSGVYMPNGSGGWTKITTLNDFKTKSGITTMNSGWETFTKLPVGWRYGGWMKVANEPMDIEPIVGTVWTGYAGGTIGIVSYRTSPFSIKNTTTSTNGIGEPIENMYGGIAYSTADTNDGTNYYRGATPVTSTTAQCDSNGIYFLTDGAPNSTKDDMAKTILNKSLKDDTRYTIITKPTGLISPTLQSGLFSGETGGWEWIGEYAKRLNDKSRNPAGVSIKTAVAGFGSSFAGLDYNSDTKLYNCDTATAEDDAKNACKWGQKGEGYGEGGFFYTQSADDIRNSLVAFIASLNNTIPAAPSGTISVPTDPFRTSGSLPYGYLPTVEAQLSGDNNTNLIWPGNLKKYNIKNGTLYGKNDKLLFSTTTATATTESIAGKLNPSTQDLWQTTAYRVNGVDANDAAIAGGVYENLKSPSSSSYDTRTVYVEDLPSAGGGNVLRKLSVNTTTGQPSGFDSLVDTTAYSRENQIKILKFLGFSRGTYTSGGISTVADLDSIPTTVAVKNIVLTKPTAPIKVLGASIHSKPIAVSYGAELDATTGGLKEDTRKDYMLYGSMDGVLHLIKADDAPTGGKENIAIIPRVMMLTQSDAIVPNAKYSVTPARKEGVPNFGIDAPWILSAKYDYNYTSNKITPNSNAGIYAYGGMRLGGKGLLGFNLSDVDTPKAAFTANPTNNITIPANIAETGTDTSVNTSMPTIKGTNLPTGYIITITLTNSYGIQQTIQTTVDSSGNWSLKPTSSLEDGMLYTLKMTKTDPASKTAANPNGSPQTVTTFKINRANLNGNTALIDNNTADFGRLSYIFNQPTIAKMKTIDSDTTGTDVLVFGGGYDKCYENQYFQADSTDVANITDASCINPNNKTKTKTEAEGNAIYIIDAKTGERLWSTTYDASASGVTEGKKYMKNSIVAGVTVLDRDNDGFIDHLYAADLGGQVFRVDFKNGNVKTANVNITRILKDNQEGTAYARRFYERPNFSVYRDTSGALFGLVNVISGDRSSPLSTLRATDAEADRVYGILDRDITKANSALYPATGATAFTPTVKDLTVDTAGTDIVNLWTAMGTMPSSGYTATQRTTVINQLAGGTKKAWYYPLNRFDGHTGVKYSKGVGVSQVINSILYTSVYNPDMVYSQVDPCSATIKGGTEREMYCLPYGICTQQYEYDVKTSTHTGTKTGTGGFLRAGQGIQELSFGPVSASNMTTSVMISTVPISYLANSNNRVNSGSGGYALSTGSNIGLNQTGVGGASDTQGDSSGKISLNTERYVARPKTWFEK